MHLDFITIFNLEKLSKTGISLLVMETPQIDLEFRYTEKRKAMRDIPDSKFCEGCSKKVTDFITHRNLSYALEQQ